MLSAFKPNVTISIQVWLLLKHTGHTLGVTRFGLIHVQTVKKSFRRGTPPPPGIASTCYGYAAGGVPLAFTQEDFLVNVKIADTMLAAVRWLLKNSNSNTITNYYVTCYQHYSKLDIKISLNRINTVNLHEFVAKVKFPGTNVALPCLMIVFYPCVCVCVYRI